MGRLRYPGRSRRERRPLRIEFGDNRFVFIDKYFDNLHADEDLSSEGQGYIETIAFADDPSVDLAQVKDLTPC